MLFPNAKGIALANVRATQHDGLLTFRSCLKSLDSRLRGNDDRRGSLLQPALPEAAWRLLRRPACLKSRSGTGWGQALGSYPESVRLPESILMSGFIFLFATIAAGSKSQTPSSTVPKVASVSML